MKLWGCGNWKDHPHACGDKCARCLNQCSNCRIIPTRVGTSPVGAITSLAGKDHPHACGDKFISAFGTLVRNRIIPTRVGTSRTRTYPHQTEKDHPHACGDKHLQSLSHNQHIGSSPRVWGQDMALRSLPLRSRIIPTRVGTSNLH